METRKHALLVIDMQLVAFDGEVTAPVAGGSDLLDRVAKLIAVCRTHEVPVVFLEP